MSRQSRRLWKSAKTFVFVVGIIGLGIGVYVGVINPRRIAARATGAVAGAAGAVAAAGPQTASRVGDPAAAAQCRAQLTRIQGAKRALLQQSGFATGTVTWTQINQRLKLQASLRCPAGGTYSLESSEIAVRCSIGSNRTLETVDDHVAPN